MSAQLRWGSQAGDSVGSFFTFVVSWFNHIKKKQYLNPPIVKQKQAGTNRICTCKNLTGDPRACIQHLLTSLAALTFIYLAI